MKRERTKADPSALSRTWLLVACAGGVVAGLIFWITSGLTRGLLAAIIVWLVIGGVEAIISLLGDAKRD